MRDPYLYDDADILKNRANIKDTKLLRKAEADISNLAMSAIYNQEYDKFNIFVYFRYYQFAYITIQSVFFNICHTINFFFCEIDKLTC